MTGQHSWREAFSVYLQPKVLGMFFLGFAAGLPFPLVFSTLFIWLRDVGVERTTIGFFAWVGLTYSIKILWAPVVDRAPLFFLTSFFGKRRGWMLLAQAGIIAGLVGMASVDPTQHIVTMAMFALLVAFASATQDVAIDAWRIEIIEPEYQGAMAAMYQAGWRIAASLVGGAVALYVADFVSWTVSYWVMAAFMGVGVITVIFVREPEHKVNRDTMLGEQRVVDFLERTAHIPDALRMPVAWFIGAVVCPFTEFFQRNGKSALMILLFICIYRISDIALSNMASPFYIDMGYTKSEIATIAKVFVLAMSILGAMVGGVLIVRYGIMRMMLVGAVAVIVTNLMFAQLAITGKSLVGLAIVLSADNLAGGLAASAFIAYLSSLTNTAYTATQYALFSSLMTLFPKFISGFSGLVVDAYGYVAFFVYVSALGIPAVFLVLYFMKSKDFRQD